MKKIIGLGNALVDIMIPIQDDSVLRSFALPKGSMTHVAHERSGSILSECDACSLAKIQASGGSAANTIHGLARLGVPTGFIGKIGRDELGEFFRRDMEENRIAAELLIGSSQTGRAIAFVTPDSERTFATYLGAAVELTAGDLQAEKMAAYDILHIEGYLVQNHELIDNALKMAKQAGLLVSLDLASYNVVAENLSFLQEAVRRYVDILFANEDEARTFTGCSDPAEALRVMAERCPLAVVKVGKHGSLVQAEGKTYQVGARTAEPVDTTGAGDLYASGFLYGYCRGLSLPRCGEIGSLLAAQVIEVMGAKIPAERWPAITAALAAE